jgi:hypothetical protein
MCECHPTIPRRRFLELAAGAGAGLSAMPLLRTAARAATPLDPAGATWLAGDFHVHTVLSHDVWGGPGDDNTDLDEAYTLGWTAGQQIKLAEARGLDFLALTDHNRTDALRLAEYRSNKLVLVPGYEHSLSGGHAGVFMPSRDLLADVVHDTDGSTSFEGDAGLTRFVQLVHERAGMAVLNHPFYGNPEDGLAPSWRYDPAASALMDAVEAWNSMWLLRHDTVPPLEYDNHLSVGWWEQELLRRRHLGIVGGSDNHWRIATATAGVGQPTTWVLARERTPAAILDAVKAGRTTVSAQPPGLLGPRLFLDAHEQWAGGRDATIGGAVAALGPIEVRVRAVRAAGARVRLVSTGQVVGKHAVNPLDGTVTFGVVLPEGGWVRAELFYQAGLATTALTSPVYAVGAAPTSARRSPTTGAPPHYGNPLNRLRP